MEVSLVGPEEVAAAAVAALGLAESGADLLSPEGVSASLRRAASFLAPTTKRALRQAVADALAGLPGWNKDSVGGIGQVLDSLVAYRDLLELPTETERVRQIFLGPPAFVPRGTGAFFVMGVRPEGRPLLDEDVPLEVTHEGHVRTVSGADAAEVEGLLTSLGFVRLEATQWVTAPRQRPAGEVIAEFDLRLSGALPGGDLGPIPLLDPAAPATFYRGRWRAAKRGDVGHFIIRRSQAFGSNLWCYAAVADGAPTRVLDLPAADLLSPGSDEAWYLQAAMDAVLGHPQRFRVRPGARSSSVVLDLFSPLPGWAQRFVDLVGTRLMRSGPGALFSYLIESDDLTVITTFLEASLWMVATEVRA